MYRLDLKGPIGLVIGNEGEGVSRLVREKCDFIGIDPDEGRYRLPERIGGSWRAGI